MKNIKKLMSTLITVAALFTLVACGNNNGGSTAKDVDLSALKADLDTKYFSEVMMLSDADAEYVSTWYGLSEEDYKQAQGSFPGVTAVALEVMMFEANEGKLETVNAAVQKRVDDIIGGFGYPSTIEAANNALIFTEGNYVFLVMTHANTEDIQDTIDLNNQVKETILEAFK